MYTVLFGALLFIYEMRPKFIENRFRSNFGFLYKHWGRAFYLVFCGFMPLDIGKYGKGAAGAMFGAALLNFVVIFKFPPPDSRPNHPLPGEYQQAGGAGQQQGGLGQPLFGGQ